MGRQRNIYVAGNYIASQTFGTYIAHAEHVHTSQPNETSEPRIAEDVDYEELSSSTGSQTNGPELYPFVVPAKLAELKLYSMAEFEQMYRQAAEGDAKTLATFLKKYSDLRVLNTQGKNKKQIFAILQDFFSDEIHYRYNNFVTYF